MANDPRFSKNLRQDKEWNPRIFRFSRVSLKILGFQGFQGGENPGSDAREYSGQIHEVAFHPCCRTELTPTPEQSGAFILDRSSWRRTFVTCPQSPLWTKCFNAFSTSAKNKGAYQRRSCAGSNIYHHCVWAQWGLPYWIMYGDGHVGQLPREGVCMWIEHWCPGGVCCSSMSTTIRMTTMTMTTTTMAPWLRLAPSTAPFGSMRGLKQVRLVSVKAKHPNHPSHGGGPPWQQLRHDSIRLPASLRATLGGSSRTMTTHTWLH